MKRLPTLRPVVLIAALALPLSLSCTSMSAPPPADLSGRWAAPRSVPGSSLQFTLDQTADSVNGSGTYAIEAGRNGTLDVAGTYTPPLVLFSIVYDFGLRLTFAGHAEGGRMAGVVTDSTGQTRSASFIKQ